MLITTRRKARFAQRILGHLNSKIGFADVGSGGALKHPWDLLPPDKLNKFDFDPEAISETDLPICISDEAGLKPFYVAHDPRGSSLQAASVAFATRFNLHTILAKEIIRVRCLTLDQYFAGQFQTVDVLDVNAEGHDFQVLQGAKQLLTDGFIKAINVEFELAEVWQNQGWFSDIDQLLRSQQYDLANISLEYVRPANVSQLYHRGEPLWGKAIYLPKLTVWSSRRSIISPAEYREDLLKAVTLYTILDLPGRAIDLLALTRDEISVEPFAITELPQAVRSVFKFAILDSITSRLVNIGYRLGWKIGVLR